MAGVFVIGAGADAFLAGIQLVSGTVTLGTKGQSEGGSYNVGQLSAPLQGKPEVSVEGPVLAGDPHDLLKIAQALGGNLPLNVVDRVNVRLYTTMIMLKDDDFQFFEEKRATAKYTYSPSRIVTL